jgi:hypothetical protein
MNNRDRGITIALILAATSLGVRKVTEREDHVVVEFGFPEAPKNPPQRCLERPHRRYPIRK